MMQHIVFLVVLLELPKSKGAVRFRQEVIRFRDQIYMRPVIIIRL